MRRSLLLLLLGGLALWNGLRAWEAAQMLVHGLEFPRPWLLYALFAGSVWALAFLGCALGITLRRRGAARVTIAAIVVHQVFALVEQLLGTRAPEAQARLGFAALVSAALVLGAILLTMPLPRLALPSSSASANLTNERPKS